VEPDRAIGAGAFASELIVGVAELVEWLSATFALALGRPQRLRHGDIVRTAISGLGEMVNRVEQLGARSPGPGHCESKPPASVCANPTPHVCTRGERMNVR
jgi:hypothetical protein